MNKKTIELLEFPAVKTLLAGETLSGLGKRLVDELTPETRQQAVENMLRETTEAQIILETGGSPPMYGLMDLHETLQKAKTGGVLTPSALTAVGDFLRGCRATKKYMTKHLLHAPMVAGYAEGLASLPELENEITESIENNTVSSRACPRLKKIRERMRRLQEKIHDMLYKIMSAAQAKGLLQEAVVSMKNSRHVLMVKSEYKEKLAGIVHGKSGSGGTLFIEPLAVHRMGNEWRILESEEQEEVYRILSCLSAKVQDCLVELERNLEIMARYDFALAKGRLSRKMQGCAPELNKTAQVLLVGARHPLLKEKPVPLDFAIGYHYRTLVITGPNTGGKTVALKTIGLLALMTQAGLHIPAAPESRMPVFSNILADIGDGQNIAHSLSTFSSHITNIIEIMGYCRPNTLVLLDEVGTGTDPVEGSALAIAVLEYFHQGGAVTVATTHYPEIKNYALRTDGFINGSMAFDRESLQPLYRLITGRPGESNALWIAEKLGMSRAVISRAKTCMEREPEEDFLKSQNDDRPPADFSFIPGSPSPVTTPDREVKKESSIKIGDLVSIPAYNEKGVVCTAPDAKGRIRVLVKGKKMEIQKKRVRLLIPAEELYPEEYDLDVVFLDKKDRKLKKQMARRHLPGTTRILSPEERERES